MNKTLITIFFALLLSACSHSGPHPSAVKNDRPDWVDNPGPGVSASAGLHVKGEAAQEALAIARAREHIAYSLAGRVSGEHLTTLAVTNNRASVASDREIRETVKDVEVRAMVKAKWRDPDGVLWVWLVPLK